MVITDVQAKVTKTGTFDGVPIDVSGFKDGANIPTDWAVELRIWALTANKKVRIEVQEVAAADFSGAHQVLHTFSFIGPVASPAHIRVGFKKREKPKNYFGQTNAKIRLSVVEIDGSASVTYSAWIESA
jgi:hypothetical protein